jgi:TraX protein
MLLPRLVVNDGNLEALKWLGLVLMTLDHINKYVYADQCHACFNACRIVMPLFVFVLAYNLARPEALANGAYTRTLQRLTLFGIIATPAFIGLGGLLAGWWPLNILFTLLVMTAILYLLELKTCAGNIMAGLVFFVGGSSVEFWWPAIIFGLAVWQYAKEPRTSRIIMALLALASMRIINGNHWAFAFAPLAVLACLVAIPIPRLQWVFYGYYPLHLTVIWLFKQYAVFI